MIFKVKSQIPCCKRIPKVQLALTKVFLKRKYEDKTFKEACQLVGPEG